MTKLDALKEILVKVEEGSCENDGSMYLAFGDNWTHCFDAYNGLLDAAKALHEAVLGGYWWKCMDGYGPMFVQIGKPEKDVYSGVSYTNPARAWLIAIIKALIAMETPEK